MRNRRVLLAVMFVSSLALVSAQAADWSTIGSGILVFSKSEAAIKVKKSAAPCSEIRVRTKGEMVHLDSVKLTFADGSTQDIEVKQVLRPGIDSESIKIDGGPKDLETVEIFHNPGGRGASKRATITVQGHG
jgi:hypothetical protein